MLSPPCRLELEIRDGGRVSGWYWDLEGWFSCLVDACIGSFLAMQVCIADD